MLLDVSSKQMHAVEAVDVQHVAVVIPRSQVELTITAFFGEVRPRYTAPKDGRLKA